MRREAELATTLLSREYPTESSLVTRDTEFVANPSGASSLKVSGGLPVNLRVSAALIALTMAVTGPTVGHAQSALDKLKKITEQSKDLVNDARDATKEARDAAGAAKELRCDVQRDACGNVTASTGFNPSRYKTLAVALTTKGARYGNVDLDQIVRLEFENAIVRQGFAAAPAPDARRIQKRIDAEEDLSDQRLSQIRDFAKNIDAVLVVEAGNVEVARCVTKYQGRQVNGQKLSVSMSVRWVNTDAPDIPWIAKHKTSVCSPQFDSGLEDALTELTSQLASNLPSRNGKSAKP